MLGAALARRRVGRRKRVGGSGDWREGPRPSEGPTLELVGAVRRRWREAGTVSSGS